MLHARYLVLCFLLMVVHFKLSAQPGSTIDLKKPEKYENRTLASEKTTPDKIKPVRKFYQNTITHYNYVFNADQRLDEIIDRAKQSFKDDYTKLLPYYNYSLDITAGDGDIDTVIYKCNAGILLHDLRDSWIDDLYVLMGRAYLLRKNFDSAEHVFLYVNYAFAPKDEGYDVPIGSNATGNEFSISTKEKKTILGTPPKRNEDIIWIARNYIEEGKINEASAILEMLRYDPNFPERLQPTLHETIGYLFYKSGFYDSAAFHLSKATDMDDNKQDKARREYLTAQLFMASGLKEQATEYFTKSAEHTVDPYMAVYASLNAINASEDSADAVSKKVESLMRLAKKDRYVAYRDLIYYKAAEVLMQNDDYEKAYDLAKQSIKYNLNNAAQRSRSFMMLGDIDYLRPDYLLAKKNYDSVQSSSLGNVDDELRLTTRLTALTVIASNITAIHTEDSLQDVARLPEAERIALVKKTVRQLRRAQGLKDEDNSTFVNPAVQSAGDDNNSSNSNNDLFAAQAAAKGDWYFNNNTLKNAGVSTFKSTWGSRPNVDNWRRIDAVSKQISAATQGNPDADDDSDAVDSPSKKQQSDAGKSVAETVMNGDISYDVLMSYLPLTEEKLKASNNKIADAYFNNGKTFQNQLEDYNAAINSYDSLLQHFPENEHAEEALFNMVYCYKKLGKKFSADSAATALKTKYKDGRFAAILASKGQASTEEDAATKAYENIYDMFVEGRFEEAKAAKAEADSKYGRSHWTPQLLYIESIYYVSKHDDSTAIATLTTLVSQFAETPLAKRAITMMDVLRRRSEIENYLTNLQITRLPEDEPSPVVTLNNVDKVMDKKELKIDSVIEKNAPVVKTVIDTTKDMKGTVRSYIFNASDQQFVGIILNKVDPVYANETRNAFNRYNQVNFYNQKITSTSTKLNDSISIVLLGPFSDAAAALIYTEKVKPNAPAVIIPWLKAEKYSFTIISQSNLNILNDTKDLTGYKEMLDKVLPGKF